MAVKRDNLNSKQHGERGHPEERIRERAYQIWQSDGQPSGQHERHWFQAEEELSRGQRFETGHEGNLISESSRQPKPERKSRKKNSDKSL